MTLTRSTHYYESGQEDDWALRMRLKELAYARPRYGYRRLTLPLHREGWRVNHKRVERIRRRLWLNDGSCISLRRSIRTTSLAYDFMMDRTHDGRAFRIMTIIDEYTRECLNIVVGRRLRSNDVIDVLADLFIRRGPPEHIRSDNYGSEFCARAVREWLSRLGCRTVVHRAWENGYSESFNGELRDELLDREIFYTLEEAKVFIEN